MIIDVVSIIPGENALGTEPGGVICPLIKGIAVVKIEIF
jgi:hypothetical protein